MNRYRNIVVSITQTGQLVNDGKPSLGHIFRNIGGVLVFVNDFPIYPGEFLDLTAPGGAIDETKYYVRFDFAPGDQKLLCVTKTI